MHKGDIMKIIRFILIYCNDCDGFPTIEGIFNTKVEAQKKMNKKCKEFVASLDDVKLFEVSKKSAYILDDSDNEYHWSIAKKIINISEKEIKEKKYE